MIYTTIISVYIRFLGTIRKLLAWMKDNLIGERPELFFQEDSVWALLCFFNSRFLLWCIEIWQSRMRWKEVIIGHCVGKLYKHNFWPAFKGPHQTFRCLKFKSNVSYNSPFRKKCIILFLYWKKKRKVSFMVSLWLT